MADLIYVMGPSGAGKDTVLRLVRQSLAPGERVAFAHRYITRPADPRHENYIALSESEFATRRDGGLFSFHWTAHGFAYAIGIEVEIWRQAGFMVVASGSREHFSRWLPRPAGVIPVLITAPAAVLEHRLAARAREDEEARRARLARAARFDVRDPAIRRLDNSGPPEQAAAALLDLLRGSR